MKVSRPIRAFVVDDSAVARAVLRRMLERSGSIQVIGEAASGTEALERVPRAAPDIVVMDLRMPDLDGIGVTELLMAATPVPILIVSEAHDDAAGFQALAAGALDIVRKPSPNDPMTVEALLRRVRLLAAVPVVRRGRRPATSLGRVERPLRPRLVLIGASTGGPQALAELFRRLPTPLAAPVLVVQHMAPGFVEGLVDWLRGETGADVVLARDGVVLGQRIFVAPDGVHLTIDADRIALRQGAGDALCPSVDALFESVPIQMAAETLAILLTGMGRDGARGLRRLRTAGAFTIAQDQATSAVWGMPRAAVELNAAAGILSLAAIGNTLAAACRA